MSLHITMRQLQVFEAVARHLSFTRAAEELCLTQPAVSMQVKQLEAMAELPLFELVGKKVYLTDAGRTMQKHSRTVMSQLSDLERDINAMRGVDGGALKVCIAGTVNYFATRLLSKFCKKYPSVDIKLTVADRDELIARIKANQPDLALMGQPPPGLGVHARAFMENPLIVIANPQHRLAGKRKIPITELDGESFVMFEHGSETRAAMQRVFDKHGVTPTVAAQLTGVDTVKQSVEAGLGLAVVSAHTVELELDAGRLLAPDLQHFPIVRKWYVAHRKGKRLSPTAQAFVKFVLDEGRKVGA